MFFPILSLSKLFCFLKKFLEIFSLIKIVTLYHQSDDVISKKRKMDILREKGLILNSDVA